MDGGMELFPWRPQKLDHSDGCGMIKSKFTIIIRTDLQHVFVLCRRTELKYRWLTRSDRVNKQLNKWVEERPFKYVYQR